MQIPLEIQARCSLLCMLGTLLAVATTAKLAGPKTQQPAISESNLVSPNGRGSRQHESAEEQAITSQLEHLLRRPLRESDWKLVLRLVDHPAWRVRKSAFCVLETHRYEDLASIQTQLLQRTLSENFGPVATKARFDQHRECVATAEHVLEGLTEQTAARTQELLLQLTRHGPSGRIRGRAMELLSTQPSLEDIATAGLNDPSEFVRMKALKLIAEHGFTSARPVIIQLVSCSRPALRSRALKVLDRFNVPVEPNDYGESAFQTAAQLARQLQQAGMEHEDVFFESGAGRANAFVELLRSRSEDYLDRYTASRSDAEDFQGILLMAAAAAAGERKLTLRLWEQEIVRTDSDDELLDRALETLARNRMLAALDRYRSGDTAGGLQTLATIPRLAHDAGSWSSVHVYVIHSSELSAAIWQNTLDEIGGESGPPAQRPSARVDRLAKNLLNRLDLSRPDHRVEAMRRLDAWCGLSAPIRPDRSRLHPTAN